MWVFGALRTGSDPYISITRIRKLVSANEIAYHLLSTCSTHIDIVEEKDGTFGATPMIRSFSQKPMTNNDSTPYRVNVLEERENSAPPTSSAAQIEEQIYSFIQTGKSTQWGFSKSDCLVKFKNTFSESDVNKAIDQLLDDARIYDTGDEVHFKSIE